MYTELYETPGKAQEIFFETKNSKGKWVEQYKMLFDKHIPYYIATIILSKTLREAIFTNKTVDYRLMFTGKKGKKVQLLSKTGIRLNDILVNGDYHLLLVRDCDCLEGNFKNYFKYPYSNSYSSIRDFWKECVWKNGGINKSRQMPVDNSDGKMKVYELIMNNGKKYTISFFRNVYPFDHSSRKN